MAIGFIRDVMGDHDLEMEKLRDWYMNECKTLEVAYKNLGAKYRRDLYKWAKNEAELIENHKESYNKVVEECERLEKAYNELNAKYNYNEKLVTMSCEKKIEELKVSHNVELEKWKRGYEKLVAECKDTIRTWTSYLNLETIYNARINKCRKELEEFKAEHMLCEQGRRSLCSAVEVDNKELGKSRVEYEELEKLKYEIYDMSDEAKRKLMVKAVGVLETILQNDDRWSVEVSAHMAELKSKMSNVETSIPAYNDADKSLEQELNKQEEIYKEECEMWKKMLEEMEGKHKKDHEVWKRNKELMELENEELRSKWEQDRETWEQEQGNFLVAVEIGNKELAKLKLVEASLSAYKDDNESLQKNVKKLEESYKEDREMWKKKMEELKGKQKKDHDVWQRKKEMMELENEGLRYMWKQDQERWEQERMSFIGTVMEKLKAEREKDRVVWEEEKNKVVTEANEALMKKKLKYKEDRRVWNYERTNLVAEVCAANKSAEIYRDLLHGYDELDMKNDTSEEKVE